MKKWASVAVVAVLLGLTAMTTAFAGTEPGVWYPLQPMDDDFFSFSEDFEGEYTVLPGVYGPFVVDDEFPLESPPKTGEALLLAIFPVSLAALAAAGLLITRKRRTA